MEEEPVDQWEPEDFAIIERAMLFADPSLTSDYVLMISHHVPEKLLAFWQPGDLCWTSVRIEEHVGFIDFQFFNGKFYILFRCGEGLWIVDDLEGRRMPRPVVQSHLIVRIERDILRNWELLRLVEESGALFFVAEIEVPDRSNGWHPASYNDHFQVWELDVMTREAKEIKILEDRAIFLGLDAPMPIDSSKFIGVKPNHIYFINSTQVIWRLEGWGGIDMWAYSLDDGKIQSFYPDVSVSPISSPTWVIPSF